VRIRDSCHKAPQGFWVIDPDTNARVEGNSYRVLKSKWEAHRKANNLPAGEIEPWMQAQICAREGKGYCVEDSGNWWKGPSVFDMARSAVTEGAIWLIGGMKRTAHEEIAHREATCNACEFFDKHAYQGRGKCRKCGCLMKVKFEIADSKCPIGKW
jgi:hypothetical protein